MPSIDERRKEREHRTQEICGLNRETSKEAWEVVAKYSNFKRAVEVLGITQCYLDRLLLTEFRYLLRDGVLYDNLAAVLKDREHVIVRSACSSIPKDEVETLNSARREWMTKVILEDFRSTGSLESAVDRLKVDAELGRNLLIHALARDGRSLSDISKLISISRERVRQILKKEFDFNVRDFKSLRADEKRVEDSQLQGKLADWVKCHPGCTYAEVAVVFNLSLEAAYRQLPRFARHLVLAELNTPRSKASSARFTRDEILEALRHAFRLRNPSSSMYSTTAMRPITGPSYDKYRRSGDVFGPSIPRILQVFGTWRKACELAGVLAEEPVRTDYERTWTDEELLDQLSLFLLESKTPSNQAFDEWCRIETSRASFGTLRNQLQLSWSGAKNEALIRLRQSWDKSNGSL